MIFALLLLVIFNQKPSPVSLPPGTMPVKNYLVDKDEIKNIHWLEYIHFRSKEIDSTQLFQLLPDSSNFWYESTALRYRPIVLITYDQAVDYCKWRSKVVSELFGKQITYRLPSPSEWKEIAEETLKQDRKQNQRDLKETKNIVKKSAGQYLVRNATDKKIRMRNLFDNVSEMTSEEGKAMGGNNFELMDLEENLTRILNYSSANTYLGFRCIAIFE